MMLRHHGADHAQLIVVVLLDVHAHLVHQALPLVHELLSLRGGVPRLQALDLIDLFLQIFEVRDQRLLLARLGIDSGLEISLVLLRGHLLSLNGLLDGLDALLELVLGERRPDGVDNLRLEVAERLVQVVSEAAVGIADRIEVGPEAAVGIAKMGFDIVELGARVLHRFARLGPHLRRLRSS